MVFLTKKVNPSPLRYWAIQTADRPHGVVLIIVLSDNNQTAAGAAIAQHPMRNSPGKTNKSAPKIPALSSPSFGRWAVQR